MSRIADALQKAAEENASAEAPAGHAGQAALSPRLMSDVNVPWLLEATLSTEPEPASVKKRPG